MKLIERLARRDDTPERFSDFDSYAEWVTLNGVQFPLYGHNHGGESTETLEHSFTSYVDTALKSNGIVFACVAARLMLFSEASFTWRSVIDGATFGTPALGPLEQPGPGRTTQEMLALMELDCSFAGNSYWVRDGAGVRRLRPDWVGIVTGDPKRGQRSTDLLGYTYTDGGPGEGRTVETFVPGEVAHYSPYPDPSASHRGMSWITPILREVVADSRFTAHRDAVAKKGGVHTFAVKYPPLEEEMFKASVKAFREMYEGPSNSGSSIHVSGGADITPLSMDLRALDFKAVQAGGETRICAASRVPAVIAGISEGLAGSSLNQGNYAMARRQMGDLMARPAWRSACGAMQTLLEVPASARLWWDESDIGFLREDQKDAAEVLAKKSEAIRQLIDAGYEAASVIEAVDVGDLAKLKHTGLFSVQLQPAGAQNTGGDTGPAAPAAASTEGTP